MLSGLQACHPGWARLSGGPSLRSQLSEAANALAQEAVLFCLWELLLVVWGFGDRFSVVQSYLELGKSSYLSLDNAGIVIMSPVPLGTSAETGGS